MHNKKEIEQKIAQLEHDLKELTTALRALNSTIEHHHELLKLITAKITGGNNGQAR